MAVRANRETEMSENEDKSLPVSRGLLLPTLDSPADLRRLSVEQLPQLCREIREYLIDNLSQNPGHFGSSMGAVDLIVAIHYVFDTPRDRLVFDVGHQAYAHKLLTGRREAFSPRNCGYLSTDRRICQYFFRTRAYLFGSFLQNRRKIPEQSLPFVHFSDLMFGQV